MRKTQFSEGNFGHIFNRGVDKRSIVESEEDKWRFLQGCFLFNNENSSTGLLWRISKEKGKVNFKTIKEYQEKNPKGEEPLVNITANCLMPNHFHLLLQERKSDGITRFMHKLGTGFTNYFNKKYNRTGSLLQGPYKAVLVDKDDYLRYLVAYINVVNPAQIIDPSGFKSAAKIMEECKNFKWSSHLDYLGKRNSPLLEKENIKKIFSSPEEYENFAKLVLENRIKPEGADDILLE